MFPAYHPENANTAPGLGSDPISSWPQEAVDHIQNLEFQNNSLRQERDESVARKMRLKARENKITDDDVETEFANLFSATEAWSRTVQRELRRMGRDSHGILQDALQSKTRGGKTFLKYPPFCVHLLNTDGHEWISWLGKRATCFRIILPIIIWCDLEEDVFSRNFPLGIECNFASALERMVRVMKKDGEKEGISFFSLDITENNY